MTTVKKEKVRKSYRLNPYLVDFMQQYAGDKRWTETTVIEYALELLAKKEGYDIEESKAA
ncbi:MAG: hypothetical protein AAFS12_00215 [Cyanobacteria bacterium J06632_19]